MTRMTDAGRHLRILAVSWEGGGNVPPTLAGVRALADRGHDVRLVADDTMRTEAIAAGARFLPWKRAPNRRDRSCESCFIRDWEIADPLAAFLRGCERIIVGPAQAYAEDILEALAAEPSDVLLGSDLLFGSMLAGEIAKVPTALLASNISLWPLPGHPPFGPGFQPARSAAERARDAEAAAMGEQLWDGFLPGLNAARAHFGLAPLAHVGEQHLSAGRHLLATSRSFDFPAERLPDHVRYVGPLLELPSWARQRWTNRSAGRTRPLVLVSFSTTNQGQADVLQRVISGLAGEAVEVVVTLGKALEGLRLQAPANVTILPHAAHDDILAEARAIVTHGGHGTVMRSLIHGVPLVVLPMGRDQNDNAARVDYHGAGLRLDPSVPPHMLGETVRRVLSEPRFAERASALGRAIAEEGPGPERLVAEIEDFVQRSSEGARSAA
ncbi:nucleotide disphospho-sugar-binding domain-containing protein [Phreatobacter sp. AB_2022a]|uniref:nucleotide disphospho-sugar-binding domain-containing protein n=1 Tax=Phreatobacter sp. AB_2022a TaxID=3003134 RepID=UPI002286F551|nr:nucleotide disphospho-sugar-binding domain-containing protein [Phreatobacter sp. AB_2022a]MCZ0736981.1 glycosyltransferase [Phreatobacter sp. AB_2022a]